MAAGVVPIHVENEIPDEVNHRLQITGGLDQYIEVPRALHMRSVVVYSEIADESSFLYTKDEPDGDQSIEIDLCSNDLRLGELKRHLGQRGILYLRRKCSRQIFAFSLKRNGGWNCRNCANVLSINLTSKKHRELRLHMLKKKLL